MRVGLLTSDLTIKHGWGKYSLSLIDALQAHGIALRILCASNSPAHPKLDMHPILPSVVPAQRLLWPHSLLCLPAAQRLLRDCDIIHTTVEHYALLASALAGQRPLFITGHGTYVQLPKMVRWPGNELYKRAFQRGHLLCVSHHTARIARQIIPNAHISVIHNGVDAQSFADVQPAQAPFPLILSVGGIKYRKGTLQLIRALSQVRQQLPEVQCVIVGNQTAEPNYTQQVMAEVSRLKLEDCVQFTGFVDELTLHEWYRQAHLFVMPNMQDGRKFEGYGLVFLEAGAAGLPVIGTTNSGAEDAIEDGKTGILVAQERVAEDLAPVMLSILRNPQRAREMGAAGRQKAQAQSWLHVAAQLSTIYEAALHKKSDL